MALDRCRWSFGGNAFNDVRVQRPLGEKADATYDTRFFFKDFDKKFPDDLPFFFRVFDAPERFQKNFFCIDVFQIHMEPVFKDREHFFRFVFSQDAIIDKDAAQLIADSFVDKGCYDR